MNAPHAPRVTAALALATVLAACGNDAAEPPEATLDRPVLIVQLKAEPAHAMGISVSDVLDRVAPALDEDEQLPAVKVALVGVQDALLARNPVELVLAVVAFRRSFDTYVLTREDGTVHPDIGVVRLLLEDVSKLAVNPPLDTLKVK